MDAKSENIYTPETMTEPGVYNHVELEKCQQVIASLTDNGNNDMVAKTGNNCISWTTTYSVEIPTANLELSTVASSSEVFPSDWDNDGQPK